MRLKDIIKGLKVISIKGDVDIDITSITYDSRTAKPGSLFVCKGFNFDSKYILDAVENGAKAIIVEEGMIFPDNVTVISVEDTRYALAYVADMFYNHPSKKLRLIGVTGTKGKTTTTYMIKSILDAAGQKVGLIGTIQNLIGNDVLYTERTTPESLDLQALFSEMVEKGVDSVVMEVSSQGLELHRVSCCEFDIGVFTNISPDHIGPREHASFDDYLKAKARLFKMCKTGLVNIDDAHAEYIMSNAECDVITFGIEKDAHVKAVNIEKKKDGVEFDVISPWIKDRIVMNSLGNFNIYNALSAIGTCGIMGISPEIIKQGLKDVRVKGRMEVVDTGKDFTVIIDYAHNAVSLENLLNTVRGFATGRIICLFGCGGDRDKSRRFEMGEVSGRLADITIITSDNPRTEDPQAIVNDIEIGIRRTQGKYIKIVDRREAMKYAMNMAQPDDVVIFAGKGHETYQIFKDKTIHFDEREVVKEILDEMAAEA